MDLQLVPLCRVSGKLGATTLPDTPAGTRVVFEVLDGRLDGDRLNGRSISAGADWLLVGPGGVGMLDVRLMFETDDGALVYVQYNGRTDVSGGPGAAPLYIAPRFETGDERYRWLNLVQAVGKGAFDPQTGDVSYEWFEIR
jgi:hypothetical protein